MSLFQVRVIEVIQETPQIKSFRLARLDGQPFDPFEPGAHIDVGLTDITRQYSLVSPSHKLDSFIIAVKLEESGQGSSRMHQLQVGDLLDIGTPRNLLNLADGADKHLLVGGGIGITPLVPMAYQLHRTGQSFEFHYFARSESEAAFIDILKERSGFIDKVYFHFGVPPEDVAKVLARTMGGLTKNSHVYTCGPVGFMSLIEELTAPLVGEFNVHIEHFEASPAVDESENTSFEVELDTGELFEVPADRSIVEVLRENGIDVETSCNEGICGTCVNGVLEGIPDHRDNCLSKADRAANDQMALCVSRAQTPRLVIELY